MAGLFVPSFPLSICSRDDVVRKPPSWMLLVLVLLAAFGLRMGAAVVWQSRLDDQFGFPDSESYWSLGRSIAQGQPYQFGPHDFKVFRSPGYPLLLAPIFMLCGDEPSVMLARAQAALLGTMTVAGMWWLGRMLFGQRCGLLAAAIGALYPGAISAGILVLSEALFCPLMVIQLALWTAACKAQSGRRTAVFAVCAGLAAAAATLVRPSWLLFTPMAAALAVLVGGCETTRKKQLCIGLGMLAALAVGMCPWWIRNARVTGHFVPTTLQVGASLYDGLNPAATGGSDMQFGEPITAEELADFDGPPAGFEYHLDRRFRQRSVAWSTTHGPRVLQLMGVKFLRVWNVWPNEASLSSWPLRLAVFFTYVPIVIFGIIAALRTVGRGWPYVLCWLPAAYFTLLHVVFVSSIRYRQPAMLGLIVLAAGLICMRGRASEPRG
jgi:4-amino-4-deoxy-L-arabinose transferase-like glycosyltransferase